MLKYVSPEDDRYLDRLQKAAFSYFLKNVNPATGLIADTSRPNAPCSIAALGFGLTSYCVGVSRSWISRTDAATLTLTALRFLHAAPTGETDGVTGYQGFFYHFLDMKTGLRVWDSELSMVDTALLMAGVLTAAAFFNEDHNDEAEIRSLADELYRRVNWRWAQNAKGTLSQGWRPEVGFYHYGWEGYNEGSILYLLAMASPDYPLSADGYGKWAVTYQWENIYDHDFLYAGPLFIHQFSHLWVDFRGIQDAFMREKKIDYFENSRRAAYVQREYARLNPLEYEGYGELCWGLSAGDGPFGCNIRTEERDRPCFGYSARGVPYGPDDGTIALPSIAGCLPFAPEIAIPTLKHIEENYPEAFTDGAMTTGFNPSLRNELGKVWVSAGHFGLDQGVVTIMIENLRSGLIWRLMRHSPHLIKGLKRAGFRHGWLS